MDELREILQRLEEQATTRGFRAEPEDYSLDGDTGCEVCGGRGWYTPNVPVGHPEFGQTVTCRCLEDQLTETRQAHLVRYSNLGALTRFTFESLDRDGRLEGIDGKERFRAACDAALAFSSRPEGWLVLTGPHGAGKTHLAAAVSNRLILNGYSVFFVHVPELLDHLRSAYAPGSATTYDVLLEQVKETPVLVMDELCSEDTTPWAQDKLRQLVNHRCNGQLPTLITTAWPIEELDPYLCVRIQAQSGSSVFTLGVDSPVSAKTHTEIPRELLDRMSFRTFNTSYSDLEASSVFGLEFALRAARNFAENPEGWLSLYGNPGCGKTHLAVAIARERLRKGHPVMFVSVPELMDKLRRAYEPSKGMNFISFLEGVRGTPLLILDDFGRENESSWTSEVLFRILGHRYDLRLPTVITSHKDLSADKGPIGSRVRAVGTGSLINLNVPDHRDRGESRA